MFSFGKKSLKPLGGQAKGIVEFLKSPWSYNFNHDPHSSQYLYDIYTLSKHSCSSVSLLFCSSWHLPALESGCTCVSCVSSIGSCLGSDI